MISDLGLHFRIGVLMRVIMREKMQDRWVISLIFISFGLRASLDRELTRGFRLQFSTVCPKSLQYLHLILLEPSWEGLIVNIRPGGFLDWGTPIIEREGLSPGKEDLMSIMASLTAFRLLQLGRINNIWRCKGLLS